MLLNKQLIHVRYGEFGRKHHYGPNTDSIYDCLHKKKHTHTTVSYSSRQTVVSHLLFDFIVMIGVGNFRGGTATDVICTVSSIPTIYTYTQKSTWQ